jgi:hypothetical protein
VEAEDGEEADGEGVAGEEEDVAGLGGDHGRGGWGRGREFAGPVLSRHCG